MDSSQPPSSGEERCTVAGSPAPIDEKSVRRVTLAFFRDALLNPKDDDSGETPQDLPEDLCPRATVAEASSAEPTVVLRDVGDSDDASPQAQAARPSVGDDGRPQAGSSEANLFLSLRTAADNLFLDVGRAKEVKMVEQFNTEVLRLGSMRPGEYVILDTILKPLASELYTNFQWLALRCGFIGRALEYRAILLPAPRDRQRLVSASLEIAGHLIKSYTAADRRLKFPDAMVLDDLPDKDRINILGCFSDVREGEERWRCFIRISFPQLIGSEEVDTAHKLLRYLGQNNIRVRGLYTLLVGTLMFDVACILEE